MQYRENVMDSLPLQGLRVLDFSRLLPGGFCTLLLADMGAEVIKVEEPGGGDPIRYMTPPSVPGAAWVTALHRGKKSISLNLKHARGQEVARRLAATSDVVIESFRPGVAERLGVGYEALAALNPRLVYCSVTGYGQDGPYRDRAGHDINYLGYAGLLALNGTVDGPPVLPPVQIADLGGGGWPAVSAILAALLERVGSGRGRYLDVAMLDGSLTWMTLPLAGMLAGGSSPRRGQTELSGALPCYQLYRTADGRFMALGALEPAFWRAFCETVGRPDLIPQQYAMGGQGAWTIAQVADIVANQTRDAWAADFAGVEACFSPVLEPDEVSADPHVLARGMLVEAEEGQPPGRHVGPPVRFAPVHRLPPAPHLGEHTDVLLTDLGYDAASIAQLRAVGAL